MGLRVKLEFLSSSPTSAVGIQGFKTGALEGGWTREGHIDNIDQ